MIFSVDGNSVECLGSRCGIASYRAYVSDLGMRGEEYVLRTIVVEFVVDWNEELGHERTVDVLRAAMRDRLLEAA